MTDKPIYILIADYVPLANKGEEAIVRGVADMLAGDRPVRMGVFDNVRKVEDVDGITVFPVKSIFRQAGLLTAGAKHSLGAVMISMQMRLGIYSALKNLISSPNPRHKELQDFFDKAEYVLVGHDGAFCVESCGVIHLARKSGKKTGILGMSGGIGRVGRIYKAWLYRRALDESDFCVFREETSQKSMQRISSDPEKLLLAPDPAFAMRPEAAQLARDILGSYESCNKAQSSGSTVIAATVLEKGRVFNDFMPDANLDTKRAVHAEYLAQIFDALIKQRGAFVVFLPHSIEGDGNDVEAARNVVAKMNSGPDTYTIMDKNLSARTLKSVIRECDFLVGQRTHSLIGSISVGTPFLGLSNTRDSRTHGIVGAMCRCEDQIVDMDITDSVQATAKALEVFDERASIKKSLEHTRKAIAERLAEVADLVKSPRDRAGR